MSSELVTSIADSVSRLQGLDNIVLILGTLTFASLMFVLLGRKPKNKEKKSQEDK